MVADATNIVEAVPGYTLSCDFLHTISGRMTCTENEGGFTTDIPVIVQTLQYAVKSQSLTTSS